MAALEPPTRSSEPRSASAIAAARRISLNDWWCLDPIPATPIPTRARSGFGGQAPTPAGDCTRVDPSLPLSLPFQPRLAWRPRLSIGARRSLRLGRRPRIGAHRLRWRLPALLRTLPELSYERLEQLRAPRYHPEVFIVRLPDDRALTCEQRRRTLLYAEEPRTRKDTVRERAFDWETAQNDRDDGTSTTRRREQSSPSAVTLRRASKR